MALERLQKILASAGIASRRKAEELITGGRISVNGEVVTTLGSKADLETDDVRVDGKRIEGPQQHLYIMLYKPREFVTTVSDPEGRPTVMDLVRDIRERIFPVGRLDYHSEGLLLLTNDGELMQQLTAPTSHIPKTYLVKVSGNPTDQDLNRLRVGIRLPAEPSMTKGRGKRRPGENRRSFAVTTLPSKVEIVREGDNPWYEITLTEGRNRQIRRMFEEIGHHVEKIKRVRYGPLTLNVEPGKWRVLSPAEVSKLRASLKKPMEIRPPRPAEAERRDIRKLAERVIGKSKQARPQREWSERAPKKDHRERPAGRSFGDRKPSSFGERAKGKTEEFGTRKKPQFGDRPPRRDFTDKPPRREFGQGEFRERKAFGDKREDRFGANRASRGERSGPRREGSGPRNERSGPGETGPRRPGGFGKSDSRFSKGERRPGSFQRNAKTEGRTSRGPRRDNGPKRTGGFGKSPRKNRPPRGPR